MFLKVINVVVLLCLLGNIETNKCPRCGGKVRLRALFEEDDPTLTKYLGQSLIRPKPIQKPPLNIPLYGTTFKGPCFRRTAIVKPAVIPRPIYIQSDCKPTIGTNDSEIATAAAVAAEMLTQLSKGNYLSPAPVNLGPSIDVSKAYQQALAGTQSSVPADALSIALAYKMYQDRFNKKVNEDALTYGFKKLPLERTESAQPYTSSISEASLYSLNGPIVELKPPPEEISITDSLSAEAMDELVDLACDTEVNDSNFVKRPTLMDLGYIPVQTRKEDFFNIDPLATPSSSEASESSAPLDTSVSEALPEAPLSSVPSESPSVNTDPALNLPLPETSESPPVVLSEIPADLIPAPVQEEKESSEEQEPIFSPPLTFEGFKPGNVIYKDLAASELKDATSSTGVNCESQEEIVTHIPVPAPSCGCQVEDLLDRIRTYARSRASFGSGSRSAYRKSDIKKYN